MKVRFIACEQVAALPGLRVRHQRKDVTEFLQNEEVVRHFLVGANPEHAELVNEKNADEQDAGRGQE